MSNPSPREHGQKHAGELLANAIHHSTGGGSNEPVTELYELLVQAGQHLVVGEPSTERSPST